jgi:surfactin family lipopeptide synthetase A/lichenysin synthetase A
LEETPVPIGAPIANKLVYILDEEKNLLPPYVRGDIYIAGAGVIKGYLNVNPKDVFFDNPFEPSRPLYRTGDVGMWNTEGEIIYLGRKDNQIKVNGQRIELEEIDAIARKCPRVRMAAAIVAEGRLILCYTSEKDSPVDKEMLQKVYERHLSKSLHPKEYILMEDMPLTGNGKVDRKALVQKVQDKREHTPVVLPQNKTEELVLEAWKETLGAVEISTESPFFEVGGNSLLLNKLKLELDKRINNSLSITDFFEYGTIKLIAEQIERKE